MKKTLKVLSLVLVFAFVLAPVVLAANTTAFNVTPQAVQGDAVTKIQTTAGQAVWVIQLIGYSLAAVMGVWMGIQWLLAQPAKKAELKGKLWSMVIGILLLVGTTALLPTIWNAIAGAI